MNARCDRTAAGVASAPGVHRVPGPASEPRWRFARLLAAPHRLAFAAAALLMAASALWWAAALLAGLLGRPWSWNLAPGPAHGLLMSLGFMPLFFTGFVFTAWPRWLACPAPRAVELLPAVLAQLCGWLIFMLALHAGPAPGLGRVLGRVLGSFGLAAAAWGWSATCWRMARMLVHSRVAEQAHARVIAAASLLGALCLWGAALALASGATAALRLFGPAALWACVGPVFAAALHRMLSGLTEALPPRLREGPLGGLGLLWLWLGVCGLELLGLVLPPSGWHAGLELAAGLAALALALRWKRLLKPGLRLPAMLHLSWIWLGLALLLAGLSQALRLASGGALSLGLVPLHAYALGFLGSGLLSMATRLACGHGGRSVVADDFIWRLFWLLQLVALLRLAAGLLAALSGPGVAALLGAAALGWAGVSLAWSCRYGRWFGRPRADGRPG